MKNLLFVIILLSTNFCFSQKELEETYFEQHIIVHPNPATESFKLITNDESEKTISIIDYNGKLIFKATTSDKNIDVLCNDWLTGTYFISLFQVTGNSQYRIAKQ